MIVKFSKGRKKCDYLIVNFGVIEGFRIEEMITVEKIPEIKKQEFLLKTLKKTLGLYVQKFRLFFPKSFPYLSSHIFIRANRFDYLCKSEIMSAYSINCDTHIINAEIFHFDKGMKHFRFNNIFSEKKP